MDVHYNWNKFNWFNERNKTEEGKMMTLIVNIFICTLARESQGCFSQCDNFDAFYFDQDEVYDPYI